VVAKKVFLIFLSLDSNTPRNLLTNVSSFAPSNIRYFIAFYRGYFVRQSNYMIQVSFAGFNVSGARH